MKSITLVAALVILVGAAKGATGDEARLPVLLVNSVGNGPDDYFLTQIAKADDAAKSLGGPSRLVKVYKGIVAGADTGKSYAVIETDSFEGISSASQLLQKTFSDKRDALGYIEDGQALALKAEYYEGGYDREWVYLTFAHVTDDPAYVQAMRDCRVLLDAHDLKDIKVNLYKVSLGRSEVTHEVTICAPTEERIHVLMDAMSAPWIADWLRSLPKMRSIVSNGLYHDVVP